MKNYTSLFWRLIEEVNVSADGLTGSAIIDEQVSKMSELLAEYSVKDFLELETTWRMFFDQAYTAKLWDASSLLSDLFFISDDWFMDFRSWLVYQGKEKYEVIMSNPDNLVYIDEVQLQNANKSERLLYIFNKERDRRVENGELPENSRRKQAEYDIPDFGEFLKTKEGFINTFPNLSKWFMKKLDSVKWK